MCQLIARCSDERSGLVGAFATERILRVSIGYPPQIPSSIMAPAGLPRPDKRQRSIAAMFGAKGPLMASASSLGASSKAATNATSTTVKNTFLSKAKNDQKKSSSTSTVLAAGRLTRVPYHKLQEVDPESYHDTLSSEFKELLALELHPENGLGTSYLRVLRAQLTKQYFLDLKRYLISEGLNQPRNDIYPSAKNIYNWSRSTPLDQIRVVIIGQDPYHGPGQAHGLSFSVPKGIPIPGSLRNIYQELKSEYPEFKIPTHGNLNSWAQSGVLLLNTSLTVKKGLAGSHSNRGWEQFTDAVVDAIDMYGGLSHLTEQTSRGVDQNLEPPVKRVKLDHEPASEPERSSVHDPQPTISASNPTSTTDLHEAESLIAAEKSFTSVEHVTQELQNHVAERSDTNATKPDSAESDSKPEDQDNRDTITEGSPKSPNARKLPEPAGFGKGVVFLCWGKWAADRVARLSESKHLILKSAHPSPLSAHRGFLGNNHFKLANEWLENKYGQSAKIDWCDLKA